jgi:uncharacterized membrane protein YjgN (DUF898 family)
MSNNFKFHGSASSYLGIGIVSTLITVFTGGIALPWAICMREAWKVEHTSIQGRKLKFTGTGFGLFGLWIKIWIFVIITLGIYMLWVGPRLQKWVVEHTDFVD